MIDRRRLKPLAFQANDAGSIPATRSKFTIAPFFLETIFSIRIG